MTTPATTPLPSDIHFTCDLGGGRTFYPYQNQPPVPILAAFGEGRLHQCRLEGTWDFERAATESRESFLRSHRQLGPKTGPDFWESMIFQFDAQRFLCADTEESFI